MFVEEVSALVDKKTLLRMYRKATDEDLGSLFVKLNARDKKNMFIEKYNSYIEIADED